MRSCVFQWFKCFQDDREDLMNNPRSDRRVTSKIDENIEKVCNLVLSDRQIRIHAIFSQRILHEHVKIVLQELILPFY